MAKKTDKRRLSAKAEVDITSIHNLGGNVRSAPSRGDGGLLQAGVKMDQAVASPGFPGPNAFSDETANAVFRTIVGMRGLGRLRLHSRAAGLGVNESALLRTLQNARRLVSFGWCQQVAWCDDAGDFSSAAKVTRFSLLGALKTAAEGQLVGVYAVRFVGKILGEDDLHRWNDKPIRTKAQVLQLLDAAIVDAGGKPRRRGGWRVAGAH